MFRPLLIASSMIALVAGGGFGTGSGSSAWVRDHNHFRAKHGAGAVTWDSQLAHKAAVHAAKMKRYNSMFHSDCYTDYPPSGENLAWGYGGCSPARRDGGPVLYSNNNDYDQHCAVASWYGEYYLWKGRGRWQGVDGVGHFTAMVWKGVDQIGCAQSGHYFVCEYGSKHCKSHSKYGGSSCWGSSPSHLPNFNSNQCSGGACVESLFSLDEIETSDAPTVGIARMSLAGAGVIAIVAGAALFARRLRARAPPLLDVGGDQECNE